MRRLNPDEAKAAHTPVDRYCFSRIGRDRVRGGSWVTRSFEGGPTCNTRTSIGGSSGGVSGVHQEVTSQVSSIGTGQGTERVGRRIGPHGEVREEMTRAVPVHQPSPTRLSQPGSPTSLQKSSGSCRRDGVRQEEARKKRSRSLSVLSPDLVGGPDLSLQHWGASHDDHVERGKGTIMETLISRGRARW